MYQDPEGISISGGPSGGLPGLPAGARSAGPPGLPAGARPVSPSNLTFAESQQLFDRKTGTRAPANLSWEELAANPGRYLPASDKIVTDIQELASTKEQLNTMSQLAAPLLKAKGAGRYWASARDAFKAYSQLDPRFQSYNTLRSQVSTQISKSFGNVGTQTEKDRYYAMQLLPSVMPFQDDARLGIMKFELLKALIADREMILRGEKTEGDKALRDRIEAFLANPDSVLGKEEAPEEKKTRGLSGGPPSLSPGRGSVTKQADEYLKSLSK